ncbi:MAG: hypothetical protein CR982_04440 [Candidatus Cloacimonadota bacterium]|nr:MAG: hypothetical protein CR982_04440 [Candidatus Cloacimonadota bacterium]PIE79481.1 MAG: hypothetical protein CSA15_02990 [Candidatus Delongbacteria bacterium]
MDFHYLRDKYPQFTYSAYSYEIESDTIRFNFVFKQSETIVFKPYQIHSFNKVTTLDRDSLDSLAFNLGMIELISYYKACCSPIISIDCGLLSEDQILFWKDLYINGLGEFFYVNKIGDIKNLFEIKSKGKKHKILNCLSNNRTMVPVGGGKDSVVSLELLKEINPSPFFINRSKASENTARIAGYKEGEFIDVKRGIDKELLKLNSLGYLNGHTPFSAMLAFTATTSAYLNGFSNIALSNESSANEGNIIFNGLDINHQYSKSFKAELSINNYIKKYISPNISYFSFLRPYSELKISELFSKFKKHHQFFRSCNKGSKSGVWCGNCPKCLFVASILLPFLDLGEVNKIFGVDIFNNKDLLDDLKGLVGIRELKPLECVGTTIEVRAAIGKWLINRKEENLPYLLKYFKSNFLDLKPFVDDFYQLTQNFNRENLVPKELYEYLR